MSDPMAMPFAPNRGRPGRTPLASWLALAVLILLGLLAWVDRGIVALMVDPIRHDLNVSEFQFGLLQGLGFALFYAICGLPLGWAADRFSRRWLIFLSAGIWSLAAAGCGVAQNFWQMLLGRFGVGFGEAGLMPASLSLISDMFHRRQLTLALTVYSFSSALGPAVATMIGGFIIGANAAGTTILPLIGVMPSWRAALIITAVPGLFLAPLVFLVPALRVRSPVAEGRADGGVPRGLVVFMLSRQRFFTCHFIGYSALTLIAYGGAAWTPAFLMRTHGWAPSTVGLYLPLFTNLPAIIGSSIGAIIVDRAVATNRLTIHFDYYAIGAVVVGVAGVLAFTSHSVAATAFGLALAFTFLAAGGIASSALQLATPPELRGRISAIYLFVTTLIGGSLGPLIVASFTQFVFHDTMKVGLGIAATYAVFAPVAAIAFLLGRPALRAAIATD